MWRVRAKSAILLGLHAADSIRFAIQKDPIRKPRIQFLYLHHVFTDEVSSFRALLKRLASIGRFVSHSQGVEAAKTGAIDQPLFSISFDDGLGNCVTAGRILSEFGIPACFFVCPSIVDRARDAAFVGRWCRERLHNNPAKVMDWDDVAGLLDMGHEVGNHTATHAELGRLNASELHVEIGAARRRLVELLGERAGRHFAWPYGEARHFSDAALREVFDSGHESCSSAIRGAHGSAATSVHHVLRDHVIFTGRPSELTWFLRRNARRGMFTLS